jgi:hypothetical protein
VRHSASLTVCVLALSIAALAPTPASAFDDNPGATECRAPGAGDTVVLIGTQFCAVDQGSGGAGGTGAAGSAPGARQGFEIIWTSSDAPRDPVVECLRNPARCLSNQFGGRGGRQEIGVDGPGTGGPRRGKGAMGSGKSGTKKPKEPKPPTKAECRLLRSDIVAGRLASQFVARDRQLQAQIKGLERRLEVTSKKESEIADRLGSLRDELGTLENWRYQGNTDRVMALKVAVARGWDDLMAIRHTADSMAGKLIDMSNERDGLSRASSEAQALRYEECQARFFPSDL